MKKLKKVLAWLLASLWVFGLSFASSFAASGVAITDSITAEQKTQVTSLLTDWVSALVSVAYTFITTIITFFLRPDVLGTVVVLTIAFFVWGAIRRRLVKKSWF